MPYKSDAQRGFMHAQHPEIAKKWDKKYDTPKNLPQYAHGKPKNPEPKSPWMGMKSNKEG